ncbi:MAG: T9SS type A sorting domain-containing protein [Candidatus Marinimicrobia bacterium]|nr:T9SS type A sorting domain-containing protein [Candidatus Neomarinimicrobiota bacterium]
MKYTKSIVMCLAIGSMVFSATKVDMVKALSSTDSDHNVTMSIDSDNPVYGIQFEMKYNTNEIAVVNNSLSSTVEGFKFDYRVFEEEGKIRALMFSLEGAQLTNTNTVTDLVNIEFESVNGFNGTSKVDFNEFIIAGQHGEQLESNVSSFEVDFNQVLVPTKTELTKNYPNPFNPVTNIDYSIAIDGYVSLVVYNLNGAEVKTLLNQNMTPGTYQVQWDGTNNSGENVASGRYIVKMNTKDYSSQIKMTLLK